MASRPTLDGRRSSSKFSLRVRSWTASTRKRLSYSKSASRPHATGRTENECQLLNLPFEIREQIYKHLARDVRIIPLYFEFARVLYRASALHVLATCWQIRHEAHQLIWSQTTLNISQSSPRCLHEKRKQIIDAFRRVKHVEVARDFGLKAGNELLLSGIKEAQFLRSITIIDSDVYSFFGSNDIFWATGTPSEQVTAPVSEQIAAAELSCARTANLKLLVSSIWTNREPHPPLAVNLLLLVEAIRSRNIDCAILYWFQIRFMEQSGLHAIAIEAAIDVLNGIFHTTGVERLTNGMSEVVYDRLVDDKRDLKWDKQRKEWRHEPIM